VIRIGTRDSKLAVWQAEFVSNALQSSGHTTHLVYIKTEGDLVLDTPLPLMGGKGVFTKALDDALLSGQIDLAVHSHKDIPTRLPDNLTIAAVLEREDPRDVLVMRANHPLTADEFLSDEHPQGSVTIATSSMRRQGQWLHRYPHHKITDIRGNVQTRLKKVDDGYWDGAIFAAAGLIRLGLEHRISAYLDWMLCAPAQGAVAVMTRADDSSLIQILSEHHHVPTAVCVAAERQCLNRLEGGCSAPVGVHVRQDGNHLLLFANVLSTDGVDCFDVELEVALDDAAGVANLGIRAAEALLSAGAGDLVNQS
jgi:hydroxymethylbilane synthase